MRATSYFSASRKCMNAVIIILTLEVAVSNNSFGYFGELEQLQLLIFCISFWNRNLQ